MSDGPVPEGLELVRQAWPPVAGRPGLTQGRYGTTGNLELVAPAVDDGLWVGWFNLDPEETWSGAAVGAWSAASRFASGHRYVSADVTQVDAGPDFLEVVALTTDGTVRRHVWSPGPGFVDHGELARSVTSCSALVQLPDGTLCVTMTGPEDRVRVLAGMPGHAYPELIFVEVTPADVVQEARPASRTEQADRTDQADAEVRVGGRVEQHTVTRRGGSLWHQVTGPREGSVRSATDGDGRLVEAWIWR